MSYNITPGIRFYKIRDVVTRIGDVVVEQLLPVIKFLPTRRVFKIDDIRSVVISDTCVKYVNKVDLVKLSGVVHFREELDDNPIRVSFINYDNGQGIVTQIYQPEKDTGKVDWEIYLPSGKYLVLFQIDGCQPISHGPYVI